MAWPSTTTDRSSIRTEGDLIDKVCPKSCRDGQDGYIGVGHDNLATTTAGPSRTRKRSRPEIRAAAVSPAEALLSAEITSMPATSVGSRPLTAAAPVGSTPTPNSADEISPELTLAPQDAGLAVHRAEQQSAVFIDGDAGADRVVL